MKKITNLLIGTNNKGKLERNKSVTSKIYKNLQHI